MADNSTEKLIRRIVEEAEQSAAAAVSAAEEKAKERAREAEEESRRIMAENADAAAKYEAQVLAGSRTNAELDAKKYALHKRRELVDEAFVRAEAKIAAFSPAERRSFMLHLLIHEADGGETVCPAADYRAAVNAALDEANMTLRRAGKSPVIFGGVESGIKSGFVLYGNGYKKVCSVENLMDELKESSFAQVAAHIFKD